MRRNPTDVAIVGAGLAGIACARALRTAGLSVRLIDKGRGIGGRMATRRAVVGGVGIGFDHGAQYLADTPETAAMASAAPHALARWDMGDGRPRCVGAPGMAALPKALAEGLDVIRQVRVTEVVADATGFLLETEAGPFAARRVVLTVPAPQIAPLIGADHPVGRAAARAVMRPCLTLMAALPAGTPAPFVVRRDPGGPLRWIALDTSKPGRGRGVRAWVAQAGPDWSAARIDDDRDTVAREMLGLLSAAIGADPAEALHAVAHGWRYGLVETPLGRPFVVADGLRAAGDWCLGATAADAWRSGEAAARELLDTG